MMNSPQHSKAQLPVKKWLFIPILCASMVLLASCTTFSGPATQPVPTIKSTGDPLVDQQAQAFRNVQLWGRAHEADPKSVINIIGYAKALSLSLIHI